ncbi:hypothetical protein J6524_04730 [Bradyrhizobium sp. WSM 1738]|uniref:Gp49 family protein n=1 Tax=Bradyrhizobium hereditatis TaxID=2821405 RepID=UPI001CE2BFF3|nr:Gp49 family protein [Bradyrhizobium hereditatis]MCA6114234.1 hypothetical protein [Bradyrhizobium hereditatis]
MLSASEASIEAELKTKRLNAPRLTPEDISAAIVGEDYHVFPGTTMTVCALKLRNGFVVIGESAAASPEDFDAAIGRRIARDNARNKIWALCAMARRSLTSMHRPQISSPSPAGGARTTSSSGANSSSQ